jgi:hypothetical protein
MKELIRQLVENVLTKLGRSTDDISVLEIKGPDGPSGAIGWWETWRVCRIQSGLDVFDLHLRMADYINLLTGNANEVRRVIWKELAKS